MVRAVALDRGCRREEVQGKVIGGGECVAHHQRAELGRRGYVVRGKHHTEMCVPRCSNGLVRSQK